MSSNFKMDEQAPLDNGACSFFLARELRILITRRDNMFKFIKKLIQSIAKANDESFDKRLDCCDLNKDKKNGGTRNG